MDLERQFGRREVGYKGSDTLPYLSAIPYDERSEQRLSCSLCRQSLGAPYLETSIALLVRAKQWCLY